MNLNNINFKESLNNKLKEKNKILPVFSKKRNIRKILGIIYRVLLSDFYFQYQSKIVILFGLIFISEFIRSITRNIIFSFVGFIGIIFFELLQHNIQYSTFLQHSILKKMFIIFFLPVNNLSSMSFQIKQITLFNQAKNFFFLKIGLYFINLILYQFIKKKKFYLIPLLFQHIKLKLFKIIIRKKYSFFIINQLGIIIEKNSQLLEISRDLIDLFLDEILSIIAHLIGTFYALFFFSSGDIFGRLDNLYSSRVTLSQKVLHKNNIFTNLKQTLIHQINYLCLIFSLIWIFAFFYLSFLVIRKISIYSKQFLEDNARTQATSTDIFFNIMNLKINNGYHCDSEFLQRKFLTEKKSLQLLNNEILKLKQYENYLIFFFKYIFFYLAVTIILWKALLIEKFTISINIQRIISILSIILEKYELIFDTMDRVIGVVKRVIFSWDDFSNLEAILTFFINNDKQSTFSKNFFFKKNKQFFAVQNQNFYDEIDTKINLQSIHLNFPIIEFKNVYFKYTNSSYYVLENINFKINFNEKVGLVGITGSGKSTIINLILRLLEVTKGNIFINNINIKYFSLFSYRQLFSLIPQKPLLFNRSIFENVVYNEKFKYIDVKKMKSDFDNIIDKVGLSTLIQQKKLKEHFIVGNLGDKLSGGQKQRVLIARGFMKKSTKIFILDEITSSLDKKTEQFIINNLQTFIENKSVLCISHKLNTLKNMDKILVLSKGKIIERGTFKELLTNKNLFFNLWNINKV